MQSLVGMTLQHFLSSMVKTCYWSSHTGQWWQVEIEKILSLALDCSPVKVSAMQCYCWNNFLKKCGISKRIYAVICVVKLTFGLKLFYHITITNNDDIEMYFSNWNTKNINNFIQLKLQYINLPCMQKKCQNFYSFHFYSIKNINMDVIYGNHSKHEIHVGTEIHT